MKKEDLANAYDDLVKAYKRDSYFAALEAVKRIESLGGVTDIPVEKAGNFIKAYADLAKQARAV